MSVLFCPVTHFAILPIFKALKLFMEENQKLFDLCVQNFNKQKEQEQQKQQNNRRRWELLEKAAMENARAIRQQQTDGEAEPYSIGEGEKKPKWNGGDQLMILYK